MIVQIVTGWFLLHGLLVFADVTPVGPHGGHLLSSDAWHLEIVLDDKHGALLYLLNTQDKNPNVENASVYFLLKSKGFETNYYCPPVRHHFRCSVPHAANRTSGDELIVSASRKGITHRFTYKYGGDAQPVGPVENPTAQKPDKK